MTKEISKQSQAIYDFSRGGYVVDGELYVKHEPLALQVVCDKRFFKVLSRHLGKSTIDGIIKELRRL